MLGRVSRSSPSPAAVGLLRKGEREREEWTSFGACDAQQD